MRFMVLLIAVIILVILPVSFLGNCEKEEIVEIDFECEFDSIDLDSDSGIVSIAFDDGFYTVIARAFPIMEDFGYSGTNYIMPRFVGGSGYTGYMSWEHLKILQENCWEIGFRSTSHPRLVDLSEEEKHERLESGKKIMQEKGFIPKGFASPLGESGDALELIAEYYKYHRSSWPDGLNNLPPDDAYRLRVVLDHKGKSVEDIKNWISRADEEGKWIILLFHRIGDDGKYTTSEEDFEEIISFIYDKEMLCIPVNAVLEQIQ